jgi:hypothetical protein
VTLVLGSSKPVWISAIFRLHFKKFIYIVYKQTGLSTLRVVSRDVTFVHFGSLVEILNVLDGKFNYIDDPRIYQRPLAKRLVLSIVFDVALGGARIAQTKQ